MGGLTLKDFFFGGEDDGIYNTVHTKVFIVPIIVIMMLTAYTNMMF